MFLVVEAEYGVLVDVIGGHYDEAIEPLDTKLFTHALKGFPCDIGQVSQVSGINTYSNGSLSQVM